MILPSGREVELADIFGFHSEAPGKYFIQLREGGFHCDGKDMLVVAKAIDEAKELTSSAPSSERVCEGKR